MSDGPLQKICLLTGGHVSSTPRLVREAEALCDAGYEVHVVAGRSFPPADPLDRSLTDGARWKFHQVDTVQGGGALVLRLRQKIARRLLRLAPFASVRHAALAQYSGALKQARLAAGLRADLYIGHQLAGLAMAGLAAEEANAYLGFDIEDYHDGETSGAMDDPALVTAARLLQVRLLPGCRHLTAAAPLIAGRYREVYGVKAVTVLNVYPRTEAPPQPQPAAPISAESPAVFYWFSQTIGPDRGLEHIVRIIGRMRTPVRLQLRGHVAADYRAGLETLARDCDVKLPVEFLPSAPPAELVRLAAHAHLGLSLEERMPPNRDLCLPNKDFAYLLAGLPVLFSNTQAHTALAPELGEAALLADIYHAEEVARQLDAFLDDPERQQRARARAWELGRTRFCWEEEQQAFLASVRKTLR